MYRTIRVAAILLLIASLTACSRLSPLTPERLIQAEEKWKAHAPPLYRLITEMSGDRVETGRFEATVRSGTVVSLRRNGMILAPDRGQDYSMEGLLRILKQELALAENTSMLGAPAGYSVYPMARFDETTGRLIQYRRTVGGTANAIEIKVVDYAEQ